jgi:hypothetical protein
MGGEWARRESPATFWLCVSTLAGGCATGAVLLAAGVGASSAAAATIAVLAAAGALITVGLYGHRDARR